MNSLALCEDVQCLTGPAHHATAAPEPPALLSAGLFDRATVPILATLLLSHTQFWLPQLHQLEFGSDLGADSLGVSPLQAAPEQFNFSLVISVQVHELEPYLSSWVSHVT